MKPTVLIFLVLTLKCKIIWMCCVYEMSEINTGVILFRELGLLYCDFNLEDSIDLIYVT